MNRFLLFFVAALLFVACDNKFEDEGNTIQRVSTLPTLTAEFAEDATRTYVKDNSYLRWHEGDLISAFVGNSRNSKYIFDGKTGDNSGEFEPVSSNSSGEVYDLDRNYALYPYDEDALATDDPFICCSLPAVQEYAENSFGKGANTMVAVTKDVDDTFLAFKNVCGYLKVKLYGDATIKSIELKGNNGEKIAGEASITATYGGVPTVAMAEDATESITLDCGEGVKLSTDAENPTEFWFVVPPTEFSEGLTIVATDIYGATFEKSTSNTVVITRNEIKPMAAIEAVFEEVAKPANNEIWYTATEKVEPSYYNDNFGTKLLSNTYNSTTQEGILTFDGDITKIGDEAFYRCSSLTSITIPDSVTKIGEWAFYYCTSLTSVTIPNSVTIIGNKAFYSCTSLETIIIPSSVETIEDSAFQDCTSLFKVEFDKKSKLTVLEGAYSQYSNSYSGVFANCKSLQHINIPSSVIEIKGGAFQNCNKLLEVTFEENSSLKTIGGGYCLYDDSTYFSHYSVDRYGAFAFCSSLKEIIIPSSVETIEPCAFIGCSSLSNVSFEKDSNLKYLKGGYVYKKYGTKVYFEVTSTFGCFEDCKALTSICIPSSVEIIEACAFQSCTSLSEVIFEQGSRLKEFGDGCSGGTYYTFITGAFAKCSSLTSIRIPASVEKIGIGTFNLCESLNTVEFEDNSLLTSIGGARGSMYSYEPSDQGTKEYGAFSHCSALTSIIIPESVTDIGVVAFSNCDSLTSVTIGDGVTTIDEEAFSSCDNLTNVTIGNSVTKIGEYAFEHCAGLTSVTIPNSVTSIEWGAFSYCTNLTSVYCKATTPPTLGGYVFSDTNIETIYVPTGSVETYKTSGWKNYAHCIEGYDF